MDSIFLLIFCAILSPALVSAKEKDGVKKGYTEVYACEGKWMNLTCPSGKLLDIRRANYGRFSLRICNERGEDWASTQCMWVGTLKTVQEQCGNRSACHMLATNANFADSCPDVGKYLTVQYTCRPAPETTTTTPKSPAEDPTQDDILTKPPNKPAAVSTTPEAEVVETTPMTAAVYCSETTRRGMSWPKTLGGHPAKQQCPNDAASFAQWHCSAGGLWYPSQGPDLSRCVSGWARDLREQADRLTKARDALRIGDEIRQRSASSQLTGGDARALSGALLRTVAAARAALEDDPAERRWPEAKQLLGTVVGTSSRLLAQNRRRTWADLPSDQSVRTAVDLLDAVELNARIVADQFTATATPVITQESSIVVEVTPVKEDVLYTRLPSEPSVSGSSVQLPKEAFPKSSPRAIFASFETLGLRMKPTDAEEGERIQRREIASDVVSAVIPGRAKVAHLSRPVIITLRLHQTVNRSNPQCVWWKEAEASGEWSGSGCDITTRNDSHIVCSCSHLTSFAILMDLDGDDYAGHHHIILSFITYTGCVISIVCLTVCIFAFAIMLGSGGHSDRLLIHINLCLCLLAAELLFIFGIPQTADKLACSIVAMFLHYLFLAAFAWMLLEGVQIYAMLIEVFETADSRRKWLFLFGYGAPAAIVGICIGIDHWLHGGVGYGTANFCWLSTQHHFVLAFVVPVALAMALNAFFLLMALGIMCRHSHFGPSYRHCQHRTPLGNVWGWIRGAVVLLVLLGLTWALGVLHILFPNRPLEYAFTITNSLQGFFIFLFHVLLNDKAKKEYEKWLRRNSWLPDCIRDPALSSLYGSPPKDIGKGKTSSGGLFSGSSSGNNTASSPLPHSSPNTSYLSKYLSMKTSQVEVARRTSVECESSTRLLTHHAFFDPRNFPTDDTYGYTYAQDWSQSSGEGSPPAAPQHIYAEPLPLPLTHPPPPNFPPPAPPLHQHGGTRPTSAASSLPTSVSPAPSAPNTLYAAGASRAKLLLVGKPSLDTAFDAPPSSDNFRVPLPGGTLGRQLQPSLHAPPPPPTDSAYSDSSTSSRGSHRHPTLHPPPSSSPESGLGGPPAYETPRSSLASPHRLLT